MCSPISGDGISKWLRASEVQFHPGSSQGSQLGHPAPFLCWVGTRLGLEPTDLGLSLLSSVALGKADLSSCISVITEAGVLFVGLRALFYLC